jgi:hypothetical protein
MSAAGALVEMTAECGGTTPRNGQQHFDVLPADPLAVSFDEAAPAVRMRSATSRGGRLIYSSNGDVSFSFSESRGLAVAWR